MNDQLPLPLGTQGQRRSRAPTLPAPHKSLPPLAELHPIARVAVLTPLPHLDRPFDYAVPETLAAQAVVGARVRVRLAGRLVDGFILERVETTEHRAQPIRSVHGPAVLTREVATLCRSVADRYSGTLADVLRSAIPPRHARAESAASSSVVVDEPANLDLAAWHVYEGGPALIAGLAKPPMRAVLEVGPGLGAMARVAEIAALIRASEGGVIVVAPDAADVHRLARAFTQCGLAPACLMADDGPQRRYRTFLRILSGESRLVVGTRSAVFAPVHGLSAIIVWDDADEAHNEPHAPGWHTREVAALRSAAEGLSLVLAGPSVSLEATRMAESGWLRTVALPRPELRGRVPLIQVADDVARADSLGVGDRIPPVALQVIREGLRLGPVLINVPRVGYLPALACQACREVARCPTCGVALMARGPDRVPVCRTHGMFAGWVCGLCSGVVLRAIVVGAARTAEEFGRAFPGVMVQMSSGADPIRELTRAQGIVVSTPGTEPDPGPDGYAALVLLDVSASISRPGLRVAEETLRRWFHAAALVRSGVSGGRVLVVGPSDVREVQALVRWDPRGYAARELAERRDLCLIPAVRIAVLTGPPTEVEAMVAVIAEQLGSALLRRSGPLPAGESASAWLLAASMADGPKLAAAIQREQSARSTRRAPVVTARLDPAQLP